MSKNLPVPDGQRAPINARWFWWIGPPAAIVRAYRFIPTRVRSGWNPRPTSHLALAAILNGGGWSAFRWYTTRTDSDPDWPGGNQG